jgi:succinate-semialdehyde dehydrogenase/glutarate-semialdehyde dehydrogenase
MAGQAEGRPAEGGSFVTDRSDEVRVLAAVPKQLFVGGRWRAASGGATFPVEDPATGAVLAEVADGSAPDALEALDAAAAAQPGWARRAPRERGELLRRAYDAVLERAEDFALVMTLEMGKPLAESRAEVAYGAEFLRFYAEEAVRVSGRWARTADGRGRILVMQEPVGPSLLVTPWNFPLAMATRKVAPALAAGCTAVLKPAEQAPLCSLLFAAVLEEAGLPGGVLNVLTTSRPAAATAPLFEDRRLRKLSFTGSTEVGRELMAAASRNLLRVSMELGGAAPFLVFEDADLDAAVEGAFVAKMRNVGEACTAANRFHVAEPIASAFAERLAERMGALRMGRGTEPGVDVGPLIDAAGRDKVAALVEDAAARGAKVLVGGRPRGGPGYFYEPTVLAPVPEGARVLEEEIFGPVAPVAVFGTEEEAVAAANATPYGLVAYVYTSNLGRALRVVEALETGMVGLNQGMVSNPAAPFGGVKHSGFGREGGPEGLQEYLVTKYVAIRP